MSDSGTYSEFLLWDDTSGEVKIGCGEGQIFSIVVKDVKDQILFERMCIQVEEIKKLHAFLGFALGIYKNT
jgi:hypothetical protein